VLYGILTGKKAFSGESREETVSDVLAAVLRAEPDWGALPRTNSDQLRFLIEHCLEKDRSSRFRDIGDVAIQIQAPTGLFGIEQLGTQPQNLPRRMQLATSLVAIVAAAILGGAAVWLFGPSRTEEPKQVIRFTLPLRLPDGEGLAGGWGNPPFSLSPSGTHLAYATSSIPDSTTQIYLRSLEILETEVVPDSQMGLDPFFSPDGSWLGFAVKTSTGFSLKKVPLGRGQRLTLLDSITDPYRGLSWGDDNSIVYAPGLDSGLFTVSADGGEARSLTSLAPGDPGHRWPQLLPGRKGVLYTVAAEGGWAEAKIVVQELESGESNLLVEGGTFGRYLPPGHLIYFRRGTLMAAPFDLGRMEMTGSPLPVVEGISQQPSSGAPRASISDSGSLAYLTQTAADGLALDSLSVVLLGRGGESQTLSEQPRPYVFPALSPDGRRIAMNISGSNQGVWILDLRSNSLRPLNSVIGSVMPVWTPDGGRIAYSARQAGAWGLYWQASNFLEPPEQLTQSDYERQPSSFSPDGKLLAYTELNSDRDGDIWILPVANGEPARPYLESEDFEGGAMFSPKGNWLAYTSNKSGQYEVYISPFPGPVQPQQISIAGGQQPRWSRDGDKLFFLDNEQKGLKVVMFEEGEGTGPGSPTPVIEFERMGEIYPPIRPMYDVMSDGEQFVIVQSPEPRDQIVPIQIVLNWFEELQRLVPTDN
jgi:serine/threonine-protein kinase